MTNRSMISQVTTYVKKSNHTRELVPMLVKWVTKGGQLRMCSNLWPNINDNKDQTFQPLFLKRNTFTKNMDRTESK